MKKLSNLPANADLFVIKAKNATNKKAKVRLQKFLYRWRLAKSFVRIEAEGIGKSLDGYSVIMKVFLAYTAYDVVAAAAGLLYVRDLNRVASEWFAGRLFISRIRNDENIRNFLLSYWKKPMSKKSVGMTDFFEGRNSDLMLVAEEIRNIFAHGELTSTGIATNTKTQRKLLNDLADEILIYSEKIFAICIDRL